MYDTLDKATFDGHFLAYALKNTKEHPPLNRWVGRRAQAFYHFITIFLGHDEANTLTFDGLNSNNLEKKQVDSIKEFMSFDSSKFDSLENFNFDTQQNLFGKTKT